MAKVFLVSMLVETFDDQSSIDEEAVANALMHIVPGVCGVGCVTIYDRPFPTMCDDPLAHDIH